LLGDGDVAPGDGEVVIGGEEGDQTEIKATDGLGEAEPVETEPVETEPIETEPAKSEPAKTETVRARPGRRCCR